jgi:hypothetical protein
MLAGDELLTTAILDRPLRNSHFLDIKGHRYRLRDLARLERGCVNVDVALVRNAGCRLTIVLTTICEAFGPHEFTIDKPQAASGAPPA